jgi:hypothetical protein
VAILLHADYIKTAKVLRGSVHLAPDERRGLSLWDEKSDQPNATLVTEVDMDIFVHLLRTLAL